MPPSADPPAGPEHLDVLATLASDLDEMAAATDRLLATVDTLDEGALAAPSLLPGWSRGHVLAHVARNADGMANLVQWARTGTETPMYPGGRAGRDAAIEAGAGRPIGDVRLDLADTGELLLGAFGDLAVEALGREVTFSSGAVARGWELPRLRTREVEIHHIDLAAGYTPADWSEAFVQRTLDQLAAQFFARGDCPVGRLMATDAAPAGADRAVAATGPTLSGPGSALLAWLTGRSDGDGLTLDSGGDVPPSPRWI